MRSSLLLTVVTLVCSGIQAHGIQPLTLEAIKAEGFSREDPFQLDWLEWVDGGNGQDGHRVYRHANNSIMLENLVSRERKVLMTVPRSTTGFALNVDNTKALFATNVTKGYRYSFFGDYHIQAVDDNLGKVPYFGTPRPLETNAVIPMDPKQNGDIQHAVWSPSDPNVLAFVRHNNIYLWNNSVITAITTTGGPELFHGVPDWAYEEEIIENRRALWFSPDGEYIAFFSFNDSQVPLYTVLYYTDQKHATPLYPLEKKIRYPKAGAPNPFVTASIVSLKTPSKPTEIPTSLAFPADDLVIGELAWLTNTHEKVIVRCFNRVQNLDKHLLYDTTTQSTKVVRERDGMDGWLDNTKAIKYLGKFNEGYLGRFDSAKKFNISHNATIDWYLDLSDQDGWQHLYLYPVNGGSPMQVTSGDWEIRSVSKVDVSNLLVYFTSTEKHPTESHPYVVSMTHGSRKELQEKPAPGFWGMSVSRAGEYYVLSYQGPDLPYQQLYSTKSPGQPMKTIRSNKNLVRVFSRYAIPNITYYDLQHPSGYNLSAKLILPVNFDANKKYPVLFTPYGGPGSQEVHRKSGILTRSLFAATDPTLEYITYTVDNRGTGFRGRKFRNYMSKNMGTVDVEDQIWAARELAKNPWVDKDKIGIWGWSNGGYLSAKVIEANSGVFSFAISTAPTSDCRLYDSLFMERYMGLPQDNEAVYQRAAVTNATGFKNLAGSFLLQHGTGDDNVHFQHSAVMTDMLMGAQVPAEKFQAQFFPDSDHGIGHNHQGVYQMEQLRVKLLEEKMRVVNVTKIEKVLVEVVRVADLALEEVEFGVKNQLGENGGGWRKNKLF